MNLGLGLGIPMMQQQGAGGGGEEYIADAVHLDGSTWLDIASLSAADSGNFSYSFWYINTALSDERTFLVVDPNGDYLVYSSFKATGEALAYIFGDIAKDVTIVPDALWHHLLVSVETNHPAGSKKLVSYLDDVLVSTVPDDDAGAAFTMAWNGKQIVFGSDISGLVPVMDVADVWIAPNVSLISGAEIPEATRRLFISAAGKPVNPSGFPASAILFSGDATAFGTNQGSGGAATVTGTLTNAATSPSD